MGDSFLSHRHLAAGVAMALIAAIVTCLTVSGSNSSDPAQHDNWRRTAHGWERTTAWPKPPPKPATNSRPQRPSFHASRSRFDTHPAGLALLQLAGSLAALAVFRSALAPATTRRPHWKAILARSFRASAFGS